MWRLQPRTSRTCHRLSTELPAPSSQLPSALASSSSSRLLAGSSFSSVSCPEAYQRPFALYLLHRLPGRGTVPPTAWLPTVQLRNLQPTTPHPGFLQIDFTPFHLTCYSPGPQDSSGPTSHQVSQVQMAPPGTHSSRPCVPPVPLPEELFPLPQPRRWGPNSA